MAPYNDLVHPYLLSASSNDPATGDIDHFILAARSFRYNGARPSISSKATLLPLMGLPMSMSVSIIFEEVGVLTILSQAISG